MCCITLPQLSQKPLDIPDLEHWGKSVELLERDIFGTSATSDIPGHCKWLPGICA